MATGYPYSPHPGIAMMRNWIETLPEIASLGEIDGEVRDWLKMAYEMDA